MNVREFKYIREIGKTQNLTRAASNLFVSQPALSKALKKIERELNVQLFYHEGNLMLPTEAGNIVLGRAEKILNLSDEMHGCLEALAHFSSGSVRVGLPSTGGFLFAQMLANFKLAHSGIELQLVEANGIDMLQHTMQNRLDVAIAMRPIKCDDVNETPIIIGNMAVSMDASHPLAQKEFVLLEDLAGEPYVSMDHTYGIGMQLDSRLRSEKAMPAPDLLGRDCSLLTHYAQLTNRLCILPEPILQYYAFPNRVIRTFLPRFPWEASIIYRKNAYMSEATSLCIRHFFNFFATHRLIVLGTGQAEYVLNEK